MSDLVEWFRAGGECAERGEECRVRDAKSGCTCTAAADEITRLTAENERLKRNLQARLADHINGTPCAEIRWQQEREALTARVEELEAMLRTASDMNEVYEGRLQELEGALRQIAEFNTWEGRRGEEDMTAIARAALAQPAEKGGE